MPRATPTGKPSATTASEFQFAVKFEQGATRFAKGDKITIVEVRGAADTFTPGNIYGITGTYALASHDRAMLAAFTIAKDAADGTGPYPCKAARRQNRLSRSHWKAASSEGNT